MNDDAEHPATRPSPLAGNQGARGFADSRHHQRTHAFRTERNGMEPVLTAGEMRGADRWTIEEFGIPGRILMETAGRDAALIIERRIGPASGLRVAVYCGKGNNGGDGFVVARYLHQRGAAVRVLALGGDEAGMSDDAAANFRLLRKLAAQNDALSVKPLHDGADLPSADVHVDALLGTGVTEELRAPLLDVVQKLNEQPGVKVAIDIPTGLHADTGVVLGSAFRADLTITMGAQKAGLVLNSGPESAGEVIVVDIGIPPRRLAAPVGSGRRGCAWLTADAPIRAMLPQRPADAHKYSVGFALVVAGSAGMTGAPVMASTAAARAGSGYVSCACDERIQDVLGVKMTEVTTIALPADDRGIDPDGAMAALESRLAKADAALIGCGLGTGESTARFIRRFLEEVEIPLVIDADAINALAADPGLLSRRSEGRWILTPHMGEFNRLVGDAARRFDLDPADRIALAQHFAAEWNCILLLKGMPSVVAAPGGRAWLPSTGNTGLATAGTGDVLAGVCTGLLAQGLAPEEAAVAALHLCGAAADRYAASRDPRSLQAMDLLEELPVVLKERF